MLKKILLEMAAIAGCVFGVYGLLTLCMFAAIGCNTTYAPPTPRDREAPRCVGLCQDDCRCVYTEDCAKGRCEPKEKRPYPLPNKGPKVIILDPNVDGTVIDVKLLPEEP